MCSSSDYATQVLLVNKSRTNKWLSFRPVGWLCCWAWERKTLHQLTFCLLWRSSTSREKATRQEVIRLQQCPSHTAPSCLIQKPVSVVQKSFLAFEIVHIDFISSYGFMLPSKDNFCWWVHRSWGSPLAHETLLLPWVWNRPGRTAVHHERWPPFLLWLLWVSLCRVLWNMWRTYW